MQAILNFAQQTGFYMFSQGGNWKMLIMIAISFVLLYLAIVKQFEPLLLLPIAFGMLCTNLPGADMFHEIIFAGGHVHWDMLHGDPLQASELLELLRSVDLTDPQKSASMIDVITPYASQLYAAALDCANTNFGAGSLEQLIAQFSGSGVTALEAQLQGIAAVQETAAAYGMEMGAVTVTAGLLDILYLGVKLGIYPCLIFMGVGSMTDFGPLIANPKSLLLGAAAQLGIFMTYVGTQFLGFTYRESSSIGIIGGADGPTAIYVTSRLAPHLLGPIAVAAYSYMALVPVIQPPIMKALTTQEERKIKMRPLRQVSQKEKIIFPIMITVFVALLVPSAAPLVACLMLGNLAKESGVADRLQKTMGNELMNIVTIFLGFTVGATATATTFLSLQTIEIMVMGVVAFGFGTAGGVLLAKLMNVFLKEKINPLIGSAGVSAVPMAARVSQVVGQKENPSNFLLMHAMGPNVAGVIGSAIAAGTLMALFG
ncbi:MAG: sodium ion-translocating decarboxylase subunit beta [Oscillospiraceae bacterium]|nr:sodium ion-translocating decarboxylase subunit beta [Oscillospiraceae bacterium]